MNKKIPAPLLVIILGILCFPLLWSCQRRSPPSQEGTISAWLTLYTSEPLELAQEAIADFQKSYPQVEVEIFRSGTGDVISRINAEMIATGGTEANLIWFADIGFMSNLDSQGLILHYSPPAAARIDPQYAYNNGMGHEVRLIYNVIAYNTRLVNTPPRDWMDLVNPAFRSMVAMANPNYSGGAFTALVAHIQNSDRVGWRFYEEMQGNDMKMELANGVLQTKVSSGEYAAVLIVDFMANNARIAGSPVNVVWPASGAVLIPTPLALVNNMSPEQEAAAKALVDHFFMDATQELFSRQGYIPVMPGAPLPPGAPAVNQIVTMPFDLDFFVRESPNIRSTYEERFGN